jgi:hypothetical protein
VVYSNKERIALKKFAVAEDTKWGLFMALLILAAPASIKMAPQWGVWARYAAVLYLLVFLAVFCWYNVRVEPRLAAEMIYRKSR